MCIYIYIYTCIGQPLHGAEPPRAGCERCPAGPGAGVLLSFQQHMYVYIYIYICTYIYIYIYI